MKIELVRCRRSRWQIFHTAYRLPLIWWERRHVIGIRAWRYMLVISWDWEDRFDD